VPVSPTAIPRNASLAKKTSLRLEDVPLVWSVQVIPDSSARADRKPAGGLWKINSLDRLIEE
jgi:hypothetical protein